MTGLVVLAPALAPLLVLAGLAWGPARGAALALAPWAAAPGLLVALLPTSAPVDLPGLLLGGRVGLDPTGRVLLGVAALVWLCAGFHVGRAHTDVSARRLLPFYLATMSGNLGLPVALDASTFQLCYAVMGFAAYGLVVHARTAEAFRAGRLYLALVVGGEMLIFAGAVLLYRAAGSVHFSELVPAALGAPAGGAAVGLLLAGFAIKSAVVPVHVWLPPAYAAAPPAGTAVLGGAMINAGLLGWLRFLPLGLAAAPALGRVCLAAGLASGVYGAVIGVFQRDPRAALGYSSVSQMGAITTGIGAVLVAPEVWPLAHVGLVLYAAHHGLTKGALFLGVGLAPQARGEVQRAMAAVGLVVPALALAGAPGTSGALAKDALKVVTHALPQPWAGLTAAVLTGMAVGTTLVLGRAFLLTAQAASAEPGPPAADRWWSWLILVGAVGGAAWWLPRVVGWSAKPATAAVIWSAGWPVLAGTLLVAAAIGARRAGWIPRWPSIPAGDIWRVAELAAAGLARRARPRRGTVPIPR